MKIQVNGDHTVVVDAGLRHSIESEVSRLLERFATRLTRVDVHFSDVDNKKTGRADKRCLIEARLAGAQPLTVSAKATNTSPALDQALRRMQRSLSTSFLRRRSRRCESHCVLGRSPDPPRRPDEDQLRIIQHGYPIHP